MPDIWGGSEKEAFDIRMTDKKVLEAMVVYRWVHLGKEVYNYWWEE